MSAADPRSSFHPGRTSRPETVPAAWIVSSRVALRARVARALVSMGCRVQELARPPSDEMPDPALFVIDGDDADGRAFLRRVRRNRPGTPALLLIQSAGSSVAPLLLDGLADHIIARRGGPNADLIDETELIANCSKLLRGDFFGLGHHLPPSARIHRYAVGSQLDRGHFLTALQSFLIQLRCPEIMHHPMINAADALLLNAMFAAPSNPGGRPKYDHLPRSSDLVLEPTERIEAAFACDGRHVALAVTDRFGRLDRAQIAAYLAAHFEQRPAVPAEKTTGSGIGLRLVMSRAAQLVFNLDPGRRTEVIALFYVRNGNRGMAAAGQSLNVFSCQREFIVEPEDERY